MHLDLPEILTRLQNITGFKPIKFNQNSYIGVCPAHDDEKPSLSISSYREKILLNCFAGCAFNEVLKKILNNIPNRIKKTYTYTLPWELPIATTYPYLNSKGKKLYQKVRFNPKSFAIRHWNKRGVLKWGMGNNSPILYNLPNVIKSSVVVIVEGEKNADIVNSAGFVATCNFDGAGKWLPENYNKYLKGKTVYIIPDNDNPGINHANLVYTSIFSITKRVEILNLPGLAYKQDVYDWLRLGYDLSELINKK